MFKDLMKRHRRTIQGYDRVNHLPKNAEVPSQESISIESLSPSVKSPNTELNSRQSVVPLRQKDNLLACRYELKYRISEGKAQALKAYIQNYLPMDRYAMMRPDGQYPISSLYFDSAGLDLCKETLIGKVNRFKLRIRAYEDAPQSPVFFEIKRRANKIVLKSRARIQRSDLLSVLEGPVKNRDLPPKDQEALEQFLYYKQMIQGHPVVLVHYMREAFEGDTESRVRITFDRQLCYREVSRPEITLNGQEWHPLSIPFVVLEIKFTKHYPAWLREMVRAFNLNLSSMSKYVASITQSRQNGLLKVFPYYLE